MDTLHVQQLLDALPSNVVLELPGGAQIGATDDATRVTIVFRDEGTIASLARSPSLFGFAEAFVAGAIDVRGDLTSALEAAYAADARTDVAVEPPSPPPLSAADAIRFHYDVSNAFYALFLDRRMVYTCAYYRHRGASLDEAQEAKLDLVCRKLRLAPGDHLLDVGCGWGALTAFAAERYRVSALGVTLSPAQAEYATAALRAANLAELAQVHHRDYRDVAGEARFDKIAAVGLLEHVGVASYGTYFAQLYRLLRPGGLLLNHSITHATPGRHSTGMKFLTQNVFPGAEFERVSHVQARMEESGFQIVDVEALGGHYAHTTAEWLARLESRAEDARRLVGERVYRTWIGYLAAASVAFRNGWIDLHQVVGRRPDPARSREPELREDVYSPR